MMQRDLQHLLRSLRKQSLNFQFTICLLYTSTIEVVRTEELKLLGKHNFENVMAAVAMAYYDGVSMESIRKSICEFTAVAHRIEYVTEKNGVVYYNDSKRCV